MYIKNIYIYIYNIILCPRQGHLLRGVGGPRRHGQPGHQSYIILLIITIAIAATTIITLLLLIIIMTIV